MKPSFYRLLLLLLCSIYAHKLHAQTINTIAGNGTPGFSGDGGTATSAQINILSAPGENAGLAIDINGNVYFADLWNNRIRKISTTGNITTVAGSGITGTTSSYSGDGGQATDAKINFPNGVAVDGSGNIYIADTHNHRIRKVNASGVITTVAGNGAGAFGGDGGPATAAKLNFPVGVALDGSGNIYITDGANNRIRKVNPSGIISTVAGNGTGGFTGDGGPATAAELLLHGSLTQQSGNVFVDASGNLYITDAWNNRVRKVNSSGTISTFAGGGTSGLGDGGQATAASVYLPIGITGDADGYIYIADQWNHRIRKVNTSGIISTIAGDGTGAFGGDGGPASAAIFNRPGGLAFDACGNLYVADKENSRVREISTVSPVTYTSATVCEGATITLSDATPGGAWSSENTGIASSTGSNITGMSAGVATIVYTTATGCARKTVTVEPTPTLSSTPTPPEICDTHTFNYTPLSLLTGTTFTWTRTAVTGISNPSASGTGSATELLNNTTGAPIPVTYAYTLTNSNGCISTAFVTVTVDPIPSSGTITGTNWVCEGTTVNLADDVAGGVWASSDHALATIDGTGVVTGIAAGPDAILYTFTNACGSAQTVYPITVYAAGACPESVPTIATKTTVNVYPNPGNGNFTLLFSSPADEQVTVTITNLAGEKAKEFIATSNKPEEINIIKSGIYFLSAVTKSGRYNAKVVVP